jgi:hypothetical protein
VSPGLETLRLLTSEGVDCCRTVGSNSALGPALVEGVNDGAVSGATCVLPELIQPCLRPAFRSPTAQNFERQTPTSKLLSRICYPFPWGLKVVSEERHTNRTRTATADRAASHLVLQRGGILSLPVLESPEYSC